MAYLSSLASLKKYLATKPLLTLVDCRPANPALDHPERPRNKMLNVERRVVEVTSRHFALAVAGGDPSYLSWPKAKEITFVSNDPDSYDTTGFVITIKDGLRLTYRFTDKVKQ